LKLINTMRTAGAVAVLALAVPGSAAAVPSVTSVVAKTGNPGVTFLTDPTGAALTNTQTRYTVAADGYVLGFAEGNGLTGGGVLDYSALPSEYRAPMTAEQKRTYPAAQTDLQAHATCSGVAALSDGATILAWQPNGTGADPSYDYVPWQKTSAGLGDDPARWLPVVRRATGVDLAAATDFRAACERLGGTYYAADVSSPLADALIANAVAPLQTQVASLQRDNGTLQRDIARLQSENASLRRGKEASDRAAAAARDAATVARDARRAAEVAYQALFTRPIALTLAAKRFAPRNGVVMITGSATDPVTVTVEIPRRRARALRLSSRVIVEAQGVIDAEGGALLRLVPDGETARQLQSWLGGRRGRWIGATVRAESGAFTETARARLVR
jgi:hypothetical protein